MSLHENPEKPAEKQSQDSQNKTLGNQLLLLAVLIVIVGLIGTLVWDFRLQNPDAGTEHNAVLGITIFIQAMIAFFGILNLDESHATKVSPLTKGGMRGAITGAVVVTYISLVIFHTMVEFAAGQPQTKDAVKDTFVNSFTGIVNITIIFYFASEAAIHWINKTKRKE
jgi:heme/copper-type cytochrome/quinol oxidase subunit 2